MTLAPEAPTQAHALQVRTDPAGKPLAIRHDGRIWLVDPATDSQHWSGRDPGRDALRTTAVGSGDLARMETWRVQARLGTTSALRTFTLRRNPRSTQWLLETISGGEEASGN